MITITTISDTHGREPLLPGGDILIHAGDLTNHGTKEGLIKQLDYLKSQLTKYKFIILTPGNHDFWAEEDPAAFKQACLDRGLICLIEEQTEVMGLKIWASPATPTFFNWAFNYDPDPIKLIWDKVPYNLDILITHGPAQGVQDRTFRGQAAGCPSLFKHIELKKPKIHVCGHIHEDTGVTENDDTVFINTATVICQVVMDQNQIKYTFSK